MNRFDLFIRVGMILGGLALLHTMLYAFAGLSFVARADTEGRQFLIIILHLGALLLGSICTLVSLDRTP